LVAPPASPQTQKEDDNDVELFNSALHLLCGFLSSNIISLHRLQVEILLQVHINDRRLQDILSPIPAIAGRVKGTEFSFTGVSDTVKLSIEEATKDFRTLYALENEISLIGVIASKLEPDERTQKFEVGGITQVMLPKLEGGLHIYASGDALKRAISEFESLIDDKSNTKIDGLLDNLDKACSG
jgi:hypothetical protein